MKRICLLLALSLLLGICAFGGNPKNEVIVCGDDKLLVVDLDRSDGKDVAVVWSWCSKGSDLPDEYEKYFASMDECKTEKDGKWILVTSSGGGAAVIERPSGKCLFYAGKVGGAHSIELLPGNRLAVARSNEKGGIDIFDLSESDKVLATYPFEWGHGVIWNAKRQLLYALGFNELRAYSLVDWKSAKPALKLEKTWKLPTDDGHDLNRISDDELGFSTSFGVYTINLNTEEIAPFKPLEGKKFIKSFNYDKKSGSLIYTQGEIEWWTHHVYLENPEKVLCIDSVNLYKVRPVVYKRNKK